jgi:hypothetical protein
MRQLWEGEIGRGDEEWLRGATAADGESYLRKTMPLEMGIHSPKIFEFFVPLEDSAGIPRLSLKEDAICTENA